MMGFSLFTIGWCAALVYNGFLPTARTFFHGLGVHGRRHTVLAYLWPVTVPTAALVLGCHQLLLGKDS